jgi:hypothetical protein
MGDSGTVPLYSNSPGIFPREVSSGDVLVSMERAEREKDPWTWRSVLESIPLMPGVEQQLLLGELDARFSRWIRQRWEQEAPRIGLGDLVKEIREADLTYILKTDEEGNLQYDEKGDPIFQGMENVEQDEKEWRLRVEGKKAELVSLWEKEARAECQELLASFSGELGDRAAFQLQVSVSEYQQGIRQEFDRLIRQGAARFLASRLKDSFSLRKKSEEETAASVAAELIQKTEEALSESRDRLQAVREGESFLSEEMNGPGTFDPENWQEEFKEAFENGLRAWKEGEERFLQERIRWETEAQEGYIHAEESWDRAFQEFGKRRDAWMLEMRQLVESGRQAWEWNEGEFLKDYESVMQELSLRSEQELGKVRTEVEAYLSIYHRSLELVQMAEENGEIIQGEIDRLRKRMSSLEEEIVRNQREVTAREARIEELLTTDPPCIFQPYQDKAGKNYFIVQMADFKTRKQYYDFIDFLERSGYPLEWVWFEDASEEGGYTELVIKVPSPWDAVRAFKEGIHKDELSLLRSEIEGLWDRELNPRITERDDIKNQRIPDLQEEYLYWMGPAGIRNTYESSLRNTIQALYALEGRVKEYGVEEVPVGSLEREIQRVQTELELQEAQLEIARAVLEYALNESSSRPTDAETAVSLESSRRAFEQAEREYQQAIEQLNIHLGTVLDQAQKEVSESKQVLDAASESLEAARTAYEEALAVYRSGNTAVLSTLIEEYGKRISQYYGSDTGSRKEAWTRYIEGWEYQMRIELEAEAKEIVKDLEGESDFDEFPDLSKSEALYESLKGISIDWEGNEGEEEFALRLVTAGLSSSRAEELKDLYREGKAGNTLAQRKAEALLAEIQGDARATFYQLKEIRDFLLREPLDAERGKNLITDALRRERESELRYLLSRASLEWEALKYLLDGSREVGEQGKELAGFLEGLGEEHYPVDPDRIAQLGELMQNLEEALALMRAGTENEAFRESAASILAESPRDSEGTDLVGLFVVEDLSSWEEAQGRVGVYQEYATSAPALGSFIRQEIGEAVRNALDRSTRLDLSSQEEVARFYQEYLGALSTPIDSAAGSSLSIFLSSGIPPYLQELFSRILVLKARSSGMDLSWIEDSSVRGGETEGDTYLGEMKRYVSETADLYRDAFSSIANPTRDLDAYQGILQFALEVWEGEGSLSEVSRTEVNRRRETALAGEEGLLKLLEARKRLEEEREVFQRDREAYKSQVLDTRKGEMEQAGGTAARAREQYNRALSQFEQASTEYTVWKETMDRAKETYEAAKFEQRKAEQIHEYAASGYTPGGYTPQAIVEAHKADVSQVRSLLKTLERLAAMEGQPFEERMDAAYRTAQSQEAERWEAFQYLLQAEEAIREETTSLRKDLQLTLVTLAETAQRVFSLKIPGGEESLLFTLDPAVLQARNLSLWDCKSESDFAARVEAYFEGEKEEVSKNLSADITLWMAGMADRGSVEAQLREFGLAYYYDVQVQGDLEVPGASAIFSSLLNDPSWNKLIEDYLDLGPVQVPIYEYSEDEPVLIGYETSYPEKQWTVEDYLANKTGDLYHRIQGDKTLRPLYSFYKMMMATNNVREGIVYLGKDLGDFVFEHVDGPAEHQQKKYLKWWRTWTHAKGRRIRALRKDIAQVNESGASEREELAEQIEQFAATEQVRRDQQSRLNQILLAGGNVTVEGFLHLVREKTGEETSEELERIVREVWSKRDLSNGKDTLSILEAVEGEVRLRAEYAQRVALRRAEELFASRMEAYQQYRSLVDGGGENDGEEIQNLLETLYLNPSFTWEDHHEYELAALEEIESKTRAGRGDKARLHGQGIVAYLENRLEAVKNGEQERLLGELRELRKERGEWENRMKALFQTGTEEWKGASARLYGMRKRWQEEFQEEYQEAAGLWEGKHALLIQNRDQWVQECAWKAVEAGTEGIAQKFALDTDRLVSEVERIRIPDLGGKVQDVSQIVYQALDGRVMDKLLSQAGRMVNQAQLVKPLVAAYLPRVWDETGALRQAETFAQGIGEEIFRKAALVTALEMGKAVEETQKQVKERIAEANQGVEKNVTDTLRGAGYQQNGKVFIRKAIIDETLFGGIERERQEIEGYRSFQAPRFETSVQIDRAHLEGKSGDYIQAMVLRAQTEWSRYLELIFGRNSGTGDSESSWSWDGVESLKDKFCTAEQAFKASAGDGNHSDGLFPWHVGYVPVMDSRNPEKVQEEGYGELGRIFTLYFRNQARQLRGLSSFDIAWYSRKLWDDDQDNDGKSDGWFGAPTVRSLTNLAVSITATATGNPWAATALNLLDDAAFTAMDVSGGRMGLGEGLLSLGKQAGVSALSQGLNLAAVKWDAAAEFGKGFSGSVFEIGTDVGITGAQTLGTIYGSAAIDALNLGKKGLTLDMWNDIGARLAVDTVRTAVENGIGEWNLKTQRGMELSNTVFKVEAMKSLNHLMGGIAGSALEYGIMGGTKLNVLNANLFGGTVSGGMLELNLGGSSPVFEIGQGGVDVSYKQMASAIQGINETSQITSWKLGGEKGNFALEMMNLLGYTNNAANWSVGRGVFEKKIGLNWGNGVDREGNRYRGYYENGSITLNEGMVGKDFEAAAKAASVLSHEGTHYLGNRLEALSHEAGIHTYGELVQKFKMEGDREFFASMVEEFFKAENWKANTGNRDYWKLIVNADGTHSFMDDRKLILSVEYRDKEGNVIGGYIPENQDMSDVQGRAGAIAKIFGTERIEAILGSDLSNMDLYDYQTLKDVLKLSDEAIKLIQHSGKLPKTITESQRLSLAGEALLKQGGMSWDSVKNLWSGGKIELTDRVLEGGVYTWVNKEGGYDFATTALQISRDPMSYFVRQYEEGPSNQYKGLDSITVTQRDLKGNVLDKRTFDGWTTVQTMIPDAYSFNNFLDVPWTSIYGDNGTVKVGPETIAEGAVAYKLLQRTITNETLMLKAGDTYLQAVEGNLIAPGYHMGSDGNAGYANGAHLQHPTSCFGNMGCLVTGNYGSTSGLDQFNAYTSYLRNTLKLPYGYVLYGQLEQKYNPYLRVGSMR